VRGRVFVQGAETAARIAHAVAVARPLKVTPIALGEGAHVHHEDVHVQLWLVLLSHDRLFGGVHAAHRRAVVVALVARADALQEGNPPRRAPVRRALDVAQRRARSREQPLELQGSDHVGIAAQPVFLGQFGVVDLVAGGQDHRADVYRLVAGGHVVINGVHPAGEGAAHALRAHAAGQAARRLLLRRFVVVAALDFGEVVQALRDRKLRQGHARLTV